MATMKELLRAVLLGAVLVLFNATLSWLEKRLWARRDLFEQRGLLEAQESAAPYLRRVQ